MWKHRCRFVGLYLLFTLVWPSVFGYMSTELPLHILNVSFSLEPFDPENGLTVGATVATKRHHALLDNTTFVLNYTLDCKSKTTGLQLCSVTIGDQFYKEGYAFLECLIKTIQVCQEQHKDSCEFSAFIVGRNKDGAMTVSDAMKSMLVNAVPLLPVRRLKVYSIKSSTVILKWNKPDCRNMYYEYIIKTYQNSSLQRTEHVFRKISCEISGLRPYTTYTFCVFAKPDLRRQGESSKECFTTKTAEGVPKSVPIIEHVKPIATGNDIGKAVLYWKVTSLDKLNGKLRKFVISYAMKRDLNDWKNISVPATAVIGLMNHTLTDLFIDQEYALKVYLVTGGGTAPSQVESLHFATEKTSLRERLIMKDQHLWSVSVIVLVLLVIVGIILVTCWMRRRKARDLSKNLLEEQVLSVYPRSSEYQRPLAPDDADHEYHTIEDCVGMYRREHPDDEMPGSVCREVHRDAFDPLPEEPRGC